MNYNLSPASIWILTKYLDLEKNLHKNLESYELAHSIESLYHFLWDYYADWYVEYLKTDPSQKDFAKELFRQFIIMVSPYIPMEAEAIWRDFFGEKTLLAFELRDPNWSKEITSQIDLNNQKEFAVIVDFVTRVRSLRGLFAIDPASVLIIEVDSQIMPKYSAFLRKVAKTELSEVEAKNRYTIKTSDYNFSIDILRSINNLEAEIKRSTKVIESLQKQIKSLQTQLDNPIFLQKAEKSVIAQKQNDLQAREIDMQNQQQKIKFLEKQTK